MRFSRIRHVAPARAVGPGASVRLGLGPATRYTQLKERSDDDDEST